MKSRTWSVFEIAPWLAFALALFLRFVALGRVPLGDGEANLALQALELARGGRPLLAPQPGYTLLTALLFTLGGSGDGMARFWPALAGSLLALTPLLFRRWLGLGAAAALAFLIALDPGLTVLSRQADGGMLVICFAVAALGFFLNRRWALAGVCAALALLGGPLLWPGVFSAGLAWWVSARQSRGEPVEEAAGVEGHFLENFQPRAFVLGLVLTLLAVGTLLLRAPTGLSAAAGSLPAYIGGWVNPVGVSPLLLLFALAVYETFALVVGTGGIITCIRGRDPLARLLGWWFGIALALALIYPSRQVVDLCWPLLPLLALGGRWLAGWIENSRQSRFDPAVLAQVVLTVVLLVFTYLNLDATYNPFAQNLGQSSLRLAAVLAALALLALTSGLMVLGWGRVAMTTGLLAGLLIVFGINQVSGIFSAAGLGRMPFAEIWGAGDVVDEDLLLRSIHDFGLYTSGEKNIIDVSVVGFDQPSLRWALRDVQEARFVDFLPTDTQPALVITPREQTLALGQAYRGQDFIWTRKINWDILFAEDWARWLVSRQAPDDRVELILWARADLFPGETSNPALQTP